METMNSNRKKKQTEKSRNQPHAFETQWAQRQTMGQIPGFEPEEAVYQLKALE